MNAPLEFYKQSMEPSLATTEYLFSFLNGEIESYPICDTLQVDDYSKYNMAGFSQEYTVSAVGCDVQLRSAA